VADIALLHRAHIDPRCAARHAAPHDRAMRNRLALLRVAASITIAACAPPVVDSSSDAGPTDARSVDDADLPTPTFLADVWPILRNNCQTCHIGTSNPPRMFEAEPTHARLIDQASPTMPSLAWIEPRDPERSYLMHKIEGTHLGVGGRGMRMPPNGGPQLLAAQRQIIRGWIEAGAPLE